MVNYVFFLYLLPQTLPLNSDLTQPTILSNLGTSVDLVAIKFGGTSHLLCVIPYRSKSELMSLANNQGKDCFLQVRVFASDPGLIMMLGKLKVGQIFIRRPYFVFYCYLLFYTFFNKFYKEGKNAKK